MASKITSRKSTSTISKTSTKASIDNSSKNTTSNIKVDNKTDTKSKKPSTRKPRKNLKVKVSLDASGEPNLDTIKESIETQFKDNNLENNFDELFDFQTDSFKVCDSYFNLDNGKQLISHHFKSFEQFIEKYLSDIFEQFNPIEIYQEYDVETNNYKFELFISFEDYYIKPPTITEPDGETIEMTPNIARLRNLTYSSQLYVNVHMKRIIRKPNPNNPMPNLDNEDVKEMILPDIKFGKLPIMVQSKYCYLSKYEHCMIKQLGECENDLGGYFIVKGNEKVIVGQERIAGNKILVFNQQKQNKSREFEAEVRSCKDNSFSVVPSNIVKFNEKNRVFTINIQTFKNPINIFLIMKFCGFDNDKDLLESICWDVDDTVIGNEMFISLKQTLIHYKKLCLKEGITDKETLVEYILKQCTFKSNKKDYKMSLTDKVKYLYNALETDFLPHIGNNLFHKGYYISLMTRKLIMVMLGILPYDDRDSFENKRVETTGHLLAGLFRSCMSRLVKEIQKSIHKELNNKNILKNIGSKKTHADIFDIINSDNIYKIIKATSIESGIKYSLATGNWGVKTNGVGKQKVGTAQLLNRLGYNSYLSYMRRVICPSDKKKKNSKIVGPRKLHASQFGYICPAETPEGGQVGIVKNMSLAATITNQYDSTPIKVWLSHNGIKEIPRKNFNANTSEMNTLQRDTIVMVNGCIVGYHNCINKLVNNFLEARRSGIIHPYTSIRWNVDLNECTIYTDAGRLIRPVFVVDNGNQLRITKEHIKYLEQCNGDFNSILMPKQFISNFNLDELGIDLKEYEEKFAHGVIDFIDNEELNMCCIAMKPEYLTTGNDNCKHYVGNYSHCEIHPGLMLGVLACVIPFSDHSQSPRNAYQSSMGKQAMNMYLTNYLSRLDTQSYILNNIEKAMVRSNFGKYVNYNSLPPGMNAMVAIACYAGYNQEDSIILNGHSVDMGMFRTTYYHVYKDEEKKIQSNGKEEKFCKPDPQFTKGIKPGNYDKLDDRGFIKVNSHVSSKDVIIGKKLPVKNKFKNGEQIYEDCSTTIRMNESGFIDKVYVHRNESGYMCGKVRIRNERIPSIGSKFATRVGQKGTVGMILPQESMPFTKNGLVPDIIMTPHAIPSRMTIGQLLECLLGKIGAHCGGFASCTPFDKVDPHVLGQILESHGYDYCGDEVLYSGITGKQMNVKLFFGPTYYQRLKHMVEDKMHCYSEKTEALTTEGWKYVKDIKITDSIATINNNGILEYQNPTSLHKYTDGIEKDMYHISNSSIDLTVTANHRMYISTVHGPNKVWSNYKLVEAKELVGKHIKYKKNAINSNPDYQFVLPGNFTDGNNKQYNDIIVDMKAWITFIGIWMAEGWINMSQSHSMINKYSIYIAVNKQRVKNKLYPALEKLNLNYNINDDKVIIHNIQLYKYMLTLKQKAPFKELPDWCFKLSQKQSNDLIYAMCLGDGCFKNNVPNIYYTCSTKLADDFIRLCLHAGISSTKSIHQQKNDTSILNDGRVIKHNYDLYRLVIIHKKNNPSVNHGHVKNQSVQVERLYKSTENVYCISVPNETLYVRNNGKCCWSGNSRSSGPVVLLTRQPAEGRARDGGLRIGEMEKDVFNAHGTLSFMKERLMDVSDKFDVYVCSSCGNQAIVNPDPEIQKFECNLCENYSDFRHLQIPYASKLMMQELRGMNMNMTFEV